jgi:hypothetical protein
VKEGCEVMDHEELFGTIPWRCYEGKGYEGCAHPDVMIRSTWHGGRRYLGYERNDMALGGGRAHADPMRYVQ